MSTVPIPLPAATVLLLRPAVPQLQVLMVVRHEQIDFASGALVFPGGKVDPADGDPSLAPYASGAGTPDNPERAFRVAAIREAFEESGVLLARERGATDTLSATRLKELFPWRERLAAGKLNMLDPTRLNLMMLDESRSVDDALNAARARPIKSVEPRIVERDGAHWLTIDRDAGYALTEIPVDPNRHKRNR